MRAAALVALAIALGAHAAAAQPLTVRIVNVEVDGDKSVITMNRGVSDGVANGWHGRLVDKRGVTVPHGDFTVYRTEPHSCAGKVQLDPRRILANDYRVILEPPVDPPPRP
jgi:hypothetical protein